MSSICLGSWLIGAILMYTQRRDRRLLARAPRFGAALTLTLVALYALLRWRYAPGTPDSDDNVWLRGLLGAGSGFTLPLVFAWSRAFLRRDIPALLRAAPTWTAACAALGAAVAIASLTLGRQLWLRGVFDQHDMLCDADPLYVQHGLGARIHPHTHPLLPLFWRLGAAPLALIVGLEWCSLAFNCLLAGLCAGLSAAYFRALSGSRAIGLLAALILATSASHVVFGALPESWMFSAVALVSLQWLVAHSADPRIRRRHYAGAAVLAAGITITNVAAALTCCLLAQRGRGYATRWRRWALECLALAIFLFSVQLTLVPDGDPWLPAHYFDELRFIEFDTPVVQRLATLGHGLFAQNIVGWIPRETSTFGHHVLGASWHYTPLALAALAGWLMLLGVAVVRLARSKATTGPGVLSALACLVLAGGLFGYYGLSYMFLYSTTFTYCSVALIAAGFGRRFPARPRRAAQAVPAADAGLRRAAIALLLFWSVLAVVNTRFAMRLLDMLDQLRAPH